MAKLLLLSVGNILRDEQIIGTDTTSTHITVGVPVRRMLVLDTKWIESSGTRG